MHRWPHIKMRFLLLSAVLTVQTVSQAQTWLKRPVPLHLAEAAVLAAQKDFPDDKQSRYGFIDWYCQAFLDARRYGERNKNRRWGFPNEACEKGYIAGKKAWSTEFKSSAISPLHFGYLIQELEGQYHHKFERSEFIVAKTGERFHMNLGSVKRLPSEHIKIRAYVSPETALGFGHFNGWKRELILMKVIEPETE